jgi:hypothetical protein
VEPWGDRRQEIVFIGKDMEQGLIEEHLNSCLLSDDEYRMDPESWESLSDPFPAWRMRAFGLEDESVV